MISCEHEKSPASGDTGLWKAPSELGPSVNSAADARTDTPIDRRSRIRIGNRYSLATKTTWNESSVNPGWLLARGVAD